MADKHSTIYFLVGVPGSGKSTWAKNLKKKQDINILSSDNLREELTGDAGDVSTYSHQEIFNILKDRAVKKI